MGSRTERQPSVSSLGSWPGVGRVNADINNPMVSFSLSPGYGFLQPAQAEMFARQQEMLRKQNLAR